MATTKAVLLASVAKGIKDLMDKFSLFIQIMTNPTTTPYAKIMEQLDWVNGEAARSIWTGDDDIVHGMEHYIGAIRSVAVCTTRQELIALITDRILRVQDDPLIMQNKYPVVQATARGFWHVCRQQFITQIGVTSSDTRRAGRTHEFWSHIITADYFWVILLDEAVEHYEAEIEAKAEA